MKSKTNFVVRIFRDFMVMVVESKRGERLLRGVTGPPYKATLARWEHLGAHRHSFFLLRPPCPAPSDGKRVEHLVVL